MWSSVPDGGDGVPDLIERGLLVVGLDRHLEGADVVRLADGCTRQRSRQLLPGLEIAWGPAVQEQHVHGGCHGRRSYSCRCEGPTWSASQRTNGVAPSSSARIRVSHAGSCSHGSSPCRRCSVSSFSRSRSIRG